MAPTLTPAGARDIPLLQLTASKEGPLRARANQHKSQPSLVPSLHARIEVGDHQVRAVPELKIPVLHL